MTVVAAVLLIPMDYRVQCDLELQPVSRRFVAAPFAAPLEECFVEPGDIVAENEILARLDGRELKWELAGIRADLGKARKEYNTHLSEGKRGLTAIDHCTPQFGGGAGFITVSGQLLRNVRESRTARTSLMPHAVCHAMAAQRPHLARNGCLPVHSATQEYTLA